MPIHLLVVDDEEQIRDMLSRHFRYLGFDVQTAENGQDALDKMSQWKTDIVISDIRMPVMDGAELCKRIRTDYPMTRVIMITGYVTLENALACMRRGADRCIFKPIEDLTELESAVNKSVETVSYWLDVLKELAGQKEAMNGGGQAHE